MRSLLPLIGSCAIIARRAAARAARPGRSRHRGCDAVSAAYVTRLPSVPLSAATNRSASLPSRALNRNTCSSRYAFRWNGRTAIYVPCSVRFTQDQKFSTVFV